MVTFQQLVDERLGLRQIGRQGSQLRYRALLPLQRQPVAGNVQVQVVSRFKTKRHTHRSGNDKSALLTENNCGIHDVRVPSK